MVTVRETQHVQNDNYRHVAAKHPNNQPVRYEWLYTTSANIKPGMGVIRGTGAAGEATATECGAGSHLVYGIAEWDENQIANCDVAYASADLIPVIPIDGNEGLICRNVCITDPNAAIPADSTFVAGASGAFAMGSTIDTAYIQSEYYIADAANPTRLVARISKTRLWADA